MSEWDEALAGWWLGEVASDPAYSEEVMPLALAMLQPEAGKTYLDLGCGEGRLLDVIARAGAVGIGVDASPRLAARAAAIGPVAIGMLPDVGFIADASVDGVAIVLVMEHLTDWLRLLDEAARVTKPGGVLALVVNHPLITAPDSAPVVAGDDGEVLWRWGRYFDARYTEEAAGDLTIRFHHRSLSVLLGSAAHVGWSLEAIDEQGVGPKRAARDPLLAAQAEIPRLLGARWRLDSPSRATLDR